VVLLLEVKIAEIIVYNSWSGYILGLTMTFLAHAPGSQYNELHIPLLYHEMYNIKIKSEVGFVLTIHQTDVIVEHQPILNPSLQKSLLA